MELVENLVFLAGKVSSLVRSRSFALFYKNDTALVQCPVSRFQREASKKQEIEDPCIISIHGNRYNLTAWGNAHPGGGKVLQKFHNRDASKAFEAVGHSAEAYNMLKEFYIDGSSKVEAIANKRSMEKKNTWRVRRKLFTKEDPIGVRAYSIFVGFILHHEMPFAHENFMFSSSVF